MPPLNIAVLTLMGIVFAIWVYLMFRMMGRLTRQSIREHDRTGGGYVTWFGHGLRAFGGFFSDPSVATERRQLIWVTVLLMLIVVAQPLVLVRGE
ncbi:hypothetical protein [Roseobacter sp. N2S]|uniref:hypothetical protein n=1 Tax=Roseobacter sp. N2S TaxID=2663844 RepID=UPI00285B8303|nr:hypothetical protein [Roseobacter sp. N2S]MDR6267200.1 hypothetical protein [Roseobacter sp. N2S]